MKEILIFGRVGQETLPASLRECFRILQLHLTPGQAEGDFHTDAQNLRTLLGSGWTPRVFDLLNVMCALRAADRFFVSEGLFRARRTIPLAVGVTDVARWRQLHQPLTRAVAALSEDTLNFHPLPLPRVPKLAMPQPDVTAPLRSSTGQDPDCVCLFSGGADSFAGAAYLLHQHRRPILVSHSVGPISGLQKRLFVSLCARFPYLEPTWLVQVRSHPKIRKIKRESGRRLLYWRSRDQLQRLRSMFFFSLAGIIAQAVGVNEIFMCENGVIGAAVIFSPRDDNPYTTRPAEPHYLRAMEHFLQLALDRPHLRIRNPFQYMTKGEVLCYAVRLGLQDSLYHTVSCWRSGNRGVRNCGQCTPCLFRQLAFDEAGLPAPPRNYRYKYPIPKRAWRRWNSKELERLEDIRSYCAQVLEGGIPWLMGNELAVIDAIDVTGGSKASSSLEDLERRDKIAPRKMAEVILRFARATVKRLA
jgi:7-cyano-7-deazaguanine synthase in queuosine biosynthesis